MRFGWSNSLLLAFLAVEAVTGFFSLTAGGRPDNAAFIIIHRVAGYGILFILAWKLRLVFSSLKYPRSKTPRYASIFLMVVLLATLGTGFAWSLAGPYSFSLFSGVSWHINLGVLLVPVFIWHAIYQTRGFPLSFWADRRSFLRLSAAAVAGLAAWQLSELGTRVSRASDSENRFTGSYEAKSFSGNDFPRTSWLNDSPRPVGLDGWALEISGETGRTLSLSYDDLDGSAETIATLDCTGGWYSTQVWTGTPVADLLERAELLDSAASVTFTSVTGYYRRFSLDEARRYLLATRVGGERLSHSHGFPVRLVAPGKRGFEWVKWIDHIEVNDTSKWLQPPLPVQ